MLRESGPAGNWTCDVSVASPTPYCSATTQHWSDHAKLGSVVRYVLLSGGKMSIFLMGVYDPNTFRWCTVTKCGNGLDDKLINRLQRELDVKKISRVGLSTFGCSFGRLFDRVDLIKLVLNVRPSVYTCIRTSIRPQKVSSISMKFGM